MAIEGAAAGKSAAEVAARSEVIITMVPDGPEVEAAVLGPEARSKERYPDP